MKTIKINDDEIVQIIKCMESLNDCDKNILDYPHGFSDVELDEIKHDLAIREGFLRKLNSTENVSEFVESLTNVQ